MMNYPMRKNSVNDEISIGLLSHSTELGIEASGKALWLLTELLMRIHTVTT